VRDHFLQGFADKDNFLAVFLDFLSLRALLEEELHGLLDLLLLLFEVFVRK
jgi:hypothetical protein